MHPHCNLPIYLTQPKSRDNCWCCIKSLLKTRLKKWKLLKLKNKIRERTIKSWYTSFFFNEIMLATTFFLQFLKILKETRRTFFFKKKNLICIFLVPFSWRHFVKHLLNKANIKRVSIQPLRHSSNQFQSNNITSIHTSNSKITGFSICNGLL